MLSCTLPTMIARTWLDIVVWIGGLVTAIVGIVWRLYQANKANKIKRAEMLRNLIDQYNSEAICKSINAIVEQRVVFGSERGLYIGEDKTKSMMLAESALLFFSNVCYLKKTSLLTGDEFAFFEWRLRKIMSNQCVSDYVRSLSDKHKGVAMKSLLNYCPKT